MTTTSIAPSAAEEVKIGNMFCTEHPGSRICRSSSAGLVCSYSSHALDLPELLRRYPENFPATVAKRIRSATPKTRS